MTRCPSRGMDAAAPRAMDGTGAAFLLATWRDRRARTDRCREARAEGATPPCYTLCAHGRIAHDALATYLGSSDRRNEVSPRALVALRARDQQAIVDGAGMPSLSLASALPMAAARG